MVDADAVNQILSHKLADDRMRVFKDRGVLLSDARKPVDREESAIRNDAVAPKHQLVGLTLVDLLRIVVEGRAGAWLEWEYVVVVGQHDAAFGVVLI